MIIRLTMACALLFFWSDDDLKNFISTFPLVKQVLK